MFLFRTKAEPESDYGDDMISCSQIVYNYNTEKPQKVLNEYFIFVFFELGSLNDIVKNKYFQVWSSLDVNVLHL